MKIIGDVHGHITEYWKLIQNCDKSVQLGDFGFKREYDWYFKNIDSTKHSIVFGNHDYYPYLTIDNYSTFEYNNLKIMTIGGAYSIDQHLRIEGRDWFKNEEMNYQQCTECLNVYESYKPDIVLSHDCPQIIRQTQFNIVDKSITSNLLQMCFETHRPKKWIFGHHHKSINIKINNTEFICLSELETLDL